MSLPAIDTTFQMTTDRRIMLVLTDLSGCRVPFRVPSRPTFPVIKHPTDPTIRTGEVGGK